MKRIYSILLGLVCMTACQVDGLDADGEGGQTLETLYASIERGEGESTRSYLSKENQVCWQQSDQIAAFVRSTELRRYQIDDDDAGKISGNFHPVESAGTSGTRFQGIVGYYPYGSQITLHPDSYDDRKFRLDGVSIPASQTYDPDFTLQPGILPMVSCSSGDNLLFKNLCGILCVNIQGYGTVRSLSLRGNDDEIIAGTASVSLLRDGIPSLDLKVKDGSRKIELDCGEVQLSPDTPVQFMFMLAPVRFSQGFTLTITDNKGESLEKKTWKPQEIRRSRILNMSPFTFRGPEELIPENEIWYRSVDQKIIRPKGMTPYSNEYRGDKGIMKFSDPVTSIPAWAFGKDSNPGEKNLLEIFLPISVESIGDNAFKNCDTLMHITLPRNVSTVGALAFHDCDNLQEVHIKGPVHRILMKTFSKSKNLKEVIFNCPVEEVLNYAFENCVSLKKIDFPEGLKKLNQTVFYKCSSLQEVSLPSTLESIGLGTFYYCENLQRLDLPQQLSKIPDQLCYHCFNLKSVRFPSNLKVIEMKAFEDCRSLTEIELNSPNLSSIGENAFYGCRSLVKVSCSQNTPPHLGNLAFGQNKAGRKFYVPSNLVSRYKYDNDWSIHSESIVAAGN